MGHADALDQLVPAGQQLFIYVAATLQSRVVWVETYQEAKRVRIVDDTRGPGPGSDSDDAHINSGDLHHVRRTHPYRSRTSNDVSCASVWVADSALQPRVANEQAATISRGSLDNVLIVATSY